MTRALDPPCLVDAHIFLLAFSLTDSGKKLKQEKSTVFKEYNSSALLQPLSLGAL